MVWTCEGPVVDSSCCTTEVSPGSLVWRDTGVIEEEFDINLLGLLLTDSSVRLPFPFQLNSVAKKEINTRNMDMVGV